jgi:putative SOS response-associated peptidase YedK
MCGRFAQTTPADELVRIFKLVMGFDLSPRYNVAPTTEIVVIRGHADGRRAHRHRWGLVPPWADDLKIGARMINARSETVFDKASFKGPVRHQRCVIPASGFYEWVRTETGKDPVLIARRSGAPLPLAGIWTEWRAEDGAAIATASILTTQANVDLADVHHRMPVILDQGGLDLWLDPGCADRARLAPILRPAPAGDLTLRRVDRYVNNVRNEGPRCWSDPGQ